MNYAVTTYLISLGLSTIEEADAVCAIIYIMTKVIIMKHRFKEIRRCRKHKEALKYENSILSILWFCPLCRSTENIYENILYPERMEVLERRLIREFVDNDR